MEPSLIGSFGLVAALVLFALRVPIAYALASVAITCSLLIYSWRPGGVLDLGRGIFPTNALVSSSAFEFVHSYELAMIPLFIAAGNLAYHTRVTSDIYEAFRVILARIPGGLAIASLIGCGGFSAISGSSIACASSMGRICVPEMLRYNYDKRLATSCVAVGGTLGALIPPSVLFVLYALFTEQSISRLFLAGVVPGLVSLVGYIVTVLVWTHVNPKIAPKSDLTFTREARVRAVLNAWPAAMLIFIIIGGIYGGIFTASEAAAVSMIFILAHGVLSRRLSFPGFREAMRQTVHQCASLFLIAIAAKIFVSLVSLTGVTAMLVSHIEQLGWSNWSVLILISLIYILFGMFLDPVGTMLLTLPFVIPLVEGMGLDLIWFGVIVVKLLEIGLVTPPVGLNVFVIKSVSEESITLGSIFSGVSRFMILEAVVVILLISFPTISLFLPYSMK